jgi:hypothetical protein
MPLSFWLWVILGIFAAMLTACGAISAQRVTHNSLSITCTPLGIFRYFLIPALPKNHYPMIAAFMDESFDMRQSGMFAVGGVLGRGVAIFELERRWTKLRTSQGIDIKYFKASQCERGKGEFSKFVRDPENITAEERTKLESISHKFLEAIAKGHYDESHLIVSGIGIVQDDFYDVIKDAKARAILGTSPYRLAYDLAMMQCAWSMKELGTGDRVAFVCDENEQFSQFANEAFRNLKDTNPNAAEHMATFATADEKHCEALQAADAVVFEIRRTLRLALGKWKGDCENSSRYWPIRGLCS